MSWVALSSCLSLVTSSASPSSLLTCFSVSDLSRSRDSISPPLASRSSDFSCSWALRLDISDSYLKRDIYFVILFWQNHIWQTCTGSCGKTSQVFQTCHCKEGELRLHITDSQQQRKIFNILPNVTLSLNHSCTL